MDWGNLFKDTGSIVGPLILQNAPTIGGILGGLIPIPGGAIAGEALGEFLAKQFGTVNTPDAIANAIAATPTDIAAQKIQAAEAEAVAKWPALAQIAVANAQSNAAQSESVNSTMRAELVSGQSWWAWRNLYGYSVGLEATATSWVILYGLAFNGQIMQNIINSYTFFLAWYSLRFGLLGYIHNGASNEKIAAVTGEVPGVVKSIVNAVTGKKK
jgi:hypothetical protein